MLYGDIIDKKKFGFLSASWIQVPLEVREISAYVGVFAFYPIRAILGVA